MQAVIGHTQARQGGVTGVIRPVSGDFPGLYQSRSSCCSQTCARCSWDGTKGLIVDTLLGVRVGERERVVYGCGCAFGCVHGAMLDREADM